MGDKPHQADGSALMKISDRLGALTGVAFVLLAQTGLTLATGPAGNETTSGEQYLDYLHWLADHPWAQVGVSIEITGWTCLLLFIAYLSTRTKDAGWLSTAGMLGGVTFIAIKWASVGVTATAYLLRDELSAASAHQLSDLTGAAFLFGILPAGIFVAFGSAAALTTHVLGPWLGWAGVVIGVGNIAVALVTGVNMDDSFFAPSILAIMLWLVLVSLRLAFWKSRSPKTQDPGRQRQGGIEPSGDTD